MRNQSRESPRHSRYSDGISHTTIRLLTDTSSSLCRMSPKRPRHQRSSSDETGGLLYVPPCAPGSNPTYHPLAYPLLPPDPHRHAFPLCSSPPPVASSLTLCNLLFCVSSFRLPLFSSFVSPPCVLLPPSNNCTKMQLHPMIKNVDVRPDLPN